MTPLRSWAGLCVLCAGCAPAMETMDARGDASIERPAIVAVPDDVADPTRWEAPVRDAATRDASADGFGLARSNIEHVVIISQENHTFDNYFGRYCTAPAGSNPACNEGPACCERIPDTEPSGSRWVELDDALNAGRDPDHTQACEAAEINGGRMDRFVVGPACADRRNFAASPPALVQQYHDWARQYALADRYFQPIVGQTAANDMYFAAARKMFLDNEVIPYAIGQGCNPTAMTRQFVGQRTIADVLLDAGVRVAFYAEGYQRMRDSALCPLPPSDCRHGLPTYPCIYDPSDIPFNYYRQFTDNPAFLKDWDEFYRDMDAGRMPEVVYIKSVGYHTEHPGYGTSISVGVAWVRAAVERIMASRYADRTLIILTWDEGGGYFDHVSPPGVSPVDMEAPGTRIPMLAIGRFARRNFVSHVPMEHSSLVKFLEWNYTGRTGQLMARDALVNNIGSMLDPAQTGVAVPER
ncbi:MAG: alkaline phosphatase family protein [Polyangiales bacterium]